MCFLVLFCISDNAFRVLKYASIMMFTILDTTFESKVGKDESKAEFAPHCILYTSCFGIKCHLIGDGIFLITKSNIT